MQSGISITFLLFGESLVHVSRERFVFPLAVGPDIFVDLALNGLQDWDAMRSQSLRYCYGFAVLTTGHALLKWKQQRSYACLLQVYPP